MNEIEKALRTQHAQAYLQKIEKAQQQRQGMEGIIREYIKRQPRAVGQSQDSYEYQIALYLAGELNKANDVAMTKIDPCYAHNKQFDHYSK